jgi:hypothetical protein
MNITRDEYLSDSANLHQAYYAQFITDATYAFILKSLKPAAIKAALDNGDTHLNKIKIPYNHMGCGRGWWWDEAPINIALCKKLKEGNSRSTHTCVAKAAALILAKKEASK